MLVELSTDLFPSPPSSIEINALAYLALIGRHRIILADDADPAFGEWFDQLNEDAKTEWDLILSDGYDLEALEPAARVLKVNAGGPADWSSDPPSIPLTDAVRFLQQPLIALLEDWSSDRAFVLAVASLDNRSYLLKMEERGALSFDNGGGITNMPKQLLAIVSKSGGAGRVWALFDGDGLRPNEASRDSERLKQTCIDNSIEYHQLNRRSIESYLPRDALETWAVETDVPARKKKIRAFLRLNRDQRSHFNMKDGFAQDAKRTDASAGDLYDGVTAQDKEALAVGFGANIGQSYKTYSFSEQSLRDDESWHELNRFIYRLVELVR